MFRVLRRCWQKSFRCLTCQTTSQCHCFTMHRGPQTKAPYTLFCYCPISPFQHFPKLILQTYWRTASPFHCIDRGTLAEERRPLHSEDLKDWGTKGVGGGISQICLRGRTSATKFGLSHQDTPSQIYKQVSHKERLLTLHRCWGEKFCSQNR